MVTDGGSVPRGRAWRPLVIYLAVQLALMTTSASLPQPESGSLRELMVTVGTVVFAVGVARRRPRPRVAWWLIVTGAVLEVAAALAVADVYGFRRRYRHLGAGCRWCWPRPCCPTSRWA